MQSTFNKDTVVSLTPDCVSCVVDDEVVILHMKKGIYFGLNPVGASVWQLLQQPRTIAEIERHVLDTFEVPPAQCESDLRDLFEQLLAAGLVEVKAGSPSSSA